MNKKLLITIMALVFGAGLQAQRHELGIKVGTSNLVGDIGKTSYLLQGSLSPISDFGIPGYLAAMYRMNFNPHQTLRFDAGYSHIQFDDRVAKEEYRRNRKTYGTNNFYEASAIFEYNFFPVNNEQDGMLSPYIFGGIGAAMFDVVQVNFYNDFNRDSNGVALAPSSYTDFQTVAQYKDGRKVAMFIPFGAGLKYKFNKNWALNAEVLFRAINSDLVDYSNVDTKEVKTTYNNDILSAAGNASLLQSEPFYSVGKIREEQALKERQIGDPNTKDWVNTVSLGVTYSFGRPPCYCE